LHITGISFCPPNVRNSLLFTVTCKDYYFARHVSAANLVCKEVDILRKPLPLPPPTALQSVVYLGPQYNLPPFSLVSDQIFLFSLHFIPLESCPSTFYMVFLFPLFLPL
jgi:hypothetical protein